MDAHTVPTPPADGSDEDRVAERSLPRRRVCVCGSVRPRYYSRSLDAFVCPDCGGYR